MAEHDKLIDEYQAYKDKLTEYDKQVYLYESRISEYGQKIAELIMKLQKMGVNIKSLDTLVDENGQLDLGNEAALRELIDDVYAIYKSKIDEGLGILTGDGKE